MSWLQIVLALNVWVSVMLVFEVRKMGRMFNAAKSEADAWYKKYVAADERYTDLVLKVARERMKSDD